MKRRDLLKNLTAMAVAVPAVPMGSLIVGNELKAEEVPAAYVPSGEYFLFFDPAAVDIDAVTQAFLPPGMSHITVHCVPVLPQSGRTVQESIALYKTGDQIKEAGEIKGETGFNWFTDGGTLLTLPAEVKKNG